MINVCLMDVEPETANALRTTESLLRSMLMSPEYEIPGEKKLLWTIRNGIANSRNFFVLDWNEEFVSSLKQASEGAPTQVTIYKIISRRNKPINVECIGQWPTLAPVEP